MSSLNDFEGLFSTGLEDPGFFRQLHNCSALKVMCVGEGRED
jgi:hypothetical protein